MEDYFDTLSKMEYHKQMAKRLRLLDELIEHFDGSIRHLLHYADKNNIILSNMNQIQESIKRSQEFIKKADPSDQPTGNTTNNYRGGNSTLKQVLSRYGDISQDLLSVKSRDIKCK